MTQSGDIYYAGLTTPADTIVTYSDAGGIHTYTGTILLCYNSSTTSNGTSSSTSPLPSISLSETNNLNLSNHKTSSTQHIMDLNIGHDQNGTYIHKDGKKIRILHNNNR